jgi:hypothetical protein
MISYRKTAIAVGTLFILSSLTGALSVYIYGDIFRSADFLTAFFSSGNRIILGTVLELICAGAFVGVSISIFPVLSIFGKRYAIGYVIGRSFEAVPFIISIISTLSLLTLSQQFIRAGSTDTNLYLVSGSILLAIRHWADIYGPLILCGIAALPFYYILWRSKLVPRFLSLWGLIGTVFYLVAGFLGFWGMTSASSVLPVILIVPFAVNEMVLAVWFIAKGFNLSMAPSSTAT